MVSAITILPLTISSYIPVDILGEFFNTLRLHTFKVVVAVHYLQLYNYTDRSQHKCCIILT